MSSKEKDKKEKEVAEEKEEENEAAKEKEEPTELEVLTNKCEELNDKYLRLFAEFDNYKKRTSKEKLETFSDATAKTVLEILPVVDNFERALATETTDTEWRKGVEMIFTQLCDIIKKLGIEEIKAQGEQFNPEFHFAIKQVEDENAGENEIVEVLQKGYIMGDKVVRHSMVVVANP